MTADEILGVVMTWFRQVGGASLQLPSGWFGRPFDNLHRLTSGTVAADRLLLVLDDQLLLSLAHPRTVVYDQKNLRLSGFDHATWDWDEYGGGKSHLETFEGGEVSFVAP